MCFFFIRTRYSPHFAYMQSKLALLMWTLTLQRELHASRDAAYVTVNAVHPGVVNTNLYKHTNCLFRIAKFFLGRVMKVRLENPLRLKILLANELVTVCSRLRTERMLWSMQHFRRIWKVWEVITSGRRPRVRSRRQRKTSKRNNNCGTSLTRW